MTLQNIFNKLISKYYCNCQEARVGEVGKDVREAIQAVKDRVKSKELSEKEIEKIIKNNCCLGIFRFPEIAKAIHTKMDKRVEKL